jgi:hypothetical protein
MSATARDRIVWRLVAAASAALAALAARQIVRLGWRATGHDGGEDPQQPWTEAIAWAAAVGVGAGVARVLAVRGAARGWERVKGDPPPAGDGHDGKRTK